MLEATLRELFPSLDAAVTHRWGGPLAMPRDMTPSVQVNHATGLASAGGYTGDGVVLSYVCANALADLIVDPDARHGPYPPRLRPPPLASLARRAAAVGGHQRGTARGDLGRPPRAAARDREPGRPAAGSPARLS